MSLSRFFTLLILGAFVAGSSFAATVNVPGNAPTINAALELLDYNDTVPDVVVIDPGVYDEQVAPKANGGADSVAFPTAGGLTTPGMQAAVGSHPDPLTLRGSDPSNPPIIMLTNTTPAPYGVFPGNPSDFFFSAFVYCSKDITCENIELRYGPTGDYAKNGMASNMVWQDCVFSYGATGTGDDFCDYNNNLDLLSTNDPLIGLDNEYVYSNCIVDGSSVIDGSRFGTSFIWWHGYGSSAPAGNAVGSGVHMTNCVVKYIDDIVHNFRANSLGGTSGAPNGLHASDCYFSDTGNVYNLNGAMADSEIVRCVFDGAAAPGRAFQVTTREGAPNRRGIISDIIFANNLVVGADANDLITVDHSDQINVGSTPSLHIVNNTFYDYNNTNGRIRVTGAETDVLTLNISNNIFAASTAAPITTTAILVTPTNPTAIVGNISNNLFLNNTTDVNNTSNAVVAGSIVGDPLFDGTTLNIPDSPPTDLDSRLQQFHPTALAIDAGSAARYTALGGAAGDIDVDSLNDREGGTIDIGAQETNGAPLVEGWDMY